MILAFPYYGPSGKYDEAFQRQLPTLKALFDAICLSAVRPQTTAPSDYLLATDD